MFRLSTASLAAAAAIGLSAVAAPSAPARADAVCSQEVFLGHRGAPCQRKLLRRSRRADLYAEPTPAGALIQLRRGVVLYHCVGRNRAVAFAHSPRNVRACRGIDRTRDILGFP
ncbi:MAG: hypothetical protein AAF074_21545 [Pseudomonadota bacterium]